MNSSRRLLGSRGAVIGAVLFVLLALPAAVRTQSSTKEWIIISHGVGSTQSGIAVCRLDPLMPVQPPISSPLSGVLNLSPGDFVMDISAFPTTSSPMHILMGSTGVGNQGMVRRISPAFTGQTLSAVSLGGRIRGAWLVNKPFIKPHYFVTHDWPTGTTSNTAISFISIDGSQVLEQGVTGAYFHAWGRGAAFSYWDGGTPADPSDDMFRWWWTDSYRLGLVEDRLMLLEFKFADILQTDGSDPFNPPSTNQVGPPFRADVFTTQMNAMPPTRYRTAATMQGNDDTYCDLDVWRHPGPAATLVGHDYVVCAHTDFYQSQPPLWRTDLFGFNGSNFNLVETSPNTPNSLKSLSVPVNIVNSTPSLNGFANSISATSVGSQGIPPAFHQMKVIGNWMFWTTGFSLTSSGGTTLNYLYLTTAGNAQGILQTFSPGNAPMTIPNTDAVDGLVGSFSRSHVYVGGDDASNNVYRYPVQATSQNLMYSQGTGQPSPPLIPNAVEAFPVYSGAELNMSNPPIRGYPILAGLSFQMTSDLINTFDGYDPTVKGKAYHGCSAGGVTAATFFGLGGLMVLLGCSRWVLRR